VAKISPQLYIIKQSRPFILSG